MTVVSGKLLPVGLRHVQILQLNAAGYPNATSPTVVYEGVQAVGGKTFTLTIPDSRIISHTGDDRTLAQDILPPLETMTSELRVARNDLDVYAILTNTNVVTVGESKLVGIGTDLLGFEPDLSILMYQQAVDAVSGLRVWRSFLMPKARAVPKPDGMNENASEHVFQVLPKNTTKYLWGLAFALGTEGFTEAQMIEIHTQYRPWIAAWRGNNAALEFNFHADRQAAEITPSTWKIHGVWVDGVPGTPTEAADGVTFAVAPADLANIVCFYEIAD